MNDERSVEFLRDGGAGAGYLHWYFGYIKIEVVAAGAPQICRL